MDVTENERQEDRWPGRRQPEQRITDKGSRAFARRSAAPTHKQIERGKQQFDQLQKHLVEPGGTTRCPRPKSLRSPLRPNLRCSSAPRRIRAKRNLSSGRDKGQGKKVEERHQSDQPGELRAEIDDDLGILEQGQDRERRRRSAEQRGYAEHRRLLCWMIPQSSHSSFCRVPVCSKIPGDCRGLPGIQRHILVHSAPALATETPRPRSPGETGLFDMLGNTFEWLPGSSGSLSSGWDRPR